MRTQRKLLSAQLNRKPINLSLICHDLTCISLKLPISLACLTCEPKLCIHTKKGRQQKASERLKAERNRCEQLWLTKWVSNKNSATSKIVRHNQVRAYLGIQSNVILEFNDARTTTKNKGNHDPRLSIPSPSSFRQIEPSQTPTASNISSPTDPPSFLLDEETTRELPPDIIATLSKLSESDIKN